MFKKMLKTAVCALMIVLVAVPAFIVNAEGSESNAVAVTYEYGMQRGASYGKLVDDTTFFHIRSFSDENGAVEVRWDAKTDSAYVTCPDLTVIAKVGAPYIIANGRVIYSGRANFAEDGKLYVPARSLCKAFGFAIVWNAENGSVHVYNDGEPIESAETYYNKNDLYWLSRIISCEAGGTEPLIGQIAVGNVVLNRVMDESSPDTVFDVIFDKRYGVQFTPAYTPNIYKEPYEISVIAAKICLEGYSVSEDALFFYAPQYTYAAWIENTREYLFTIGGHKFFA